MNGKQLAKWYVGLVILWVMVVATLFGMSVLIQYRLETPDTIQKETTNEEDNNIAVYDIGVLEESNMFCPYCGVGVVAVNEEIVCRNEMCEVYGLPVRVLKYDDYVSVNSDNNLDEQ